MNFDQSLIDTHPVSLQGKDENNAYTA
jgi:hypothetical protein